MLEKDETIYQVVQEEGKFLVLNDAGQVVMTCQDEGSAAHYAVLLDQSYRKGFKAGYRAGRTRGED